RQDVAEILASLQQKITVLRQVSPEFIVNNPYPAIGFFSALSQSPNARAVPRISICRYYEIEMSVAALNVRFLIRTPEEALDAVQKRVQWLFDRLLRRWDVVGDERRAEWREHAHW